jgi:cobalt/nickel transport system permease protein
MGSLPDWIFHDLSEHPLPAPLRGGAPKLARKALGEIIGKARVLLGPGGQGYQGWLACLDARAKVLGLLGLLITTTLLSGLVPLAVAILFAWALALLGRVNLRRMALALLAVPVFSMAVAAPAALNIVTEGTPLWVLVHLGGGSWGPWHLPDYLTVTDRGVYVAVRFTLRSMACVSFGAVLAASGNPQDLLRGLSGLGVPAAFVMVAGMMTRYLTLLLESAEQIHLAKLSRSIGGVGAKREQAWAAAGMGELYRRSRRLAGEVTAAMVSRGYTGEGRAMGERRWRGQDVLFVAACATLAALLLVLD